MINIAAAKEQAKQRAQAFVEANAPGTGLNAKERQDVLNMVTQRELARVREQVGAELRAVLKPEMDAALAKATTAEEITEIMQRFEGEYLTLLEDV